MGRFSLATKPQPGLRQDQVGSGRSIQLTIGIAGSTQPKPTTT